MTCDTLPTFTIAIPSMADQIAAIVPADNYDVLSIFSVVLPTGETIERTTFDGTLSGGITVSRGNVQLDVTPTGWLAFIAIGDLCVDDILEEDLENIPVFLENLATCFDDGEMRQIAQTVGFGAWYAARGELLAA
jgi:hypothetical protein